jgi:pseudouridine kinase
LLDKSGELITAASDMANLTFLSKEQIRNKQEFVKQNNYVVADCNLTPETLEEIALQCAGRLIIEPVSVAKCVKLLTLLKSHKIFLATPNLDQIAALTGTRDIKTAAKHMHNLGLENLVIHAGEQGAYASNGQTITHIPAQAQLIVDVTGAGDAATAGLVHGLLQNLPLEKAAAIGQAMAARVIASTASTLD